MLCFFFISNPNYKACVSNGWRIIRARLRTENHAAMGATRPLPAVAMADRGGILTQLVHLLSNLKAGAGYLRPSRTGKARFVAIPPSGANGRRALRPGFDPASTRPRKPPAPTNGDTG
ncbi:TPA: hypothetical protein ACW2VG_003313 [Burkholderia stabilis]